MDSQQYVEYHVSTNGSDSGNGSVETPLRTISAAARLACPGDVITVHEGVYREWVNPPRGGLSDSKRIVYQAAVGERVEIKGSEAVTGWEPFALPGVWKLVLPNSFFGGYNPYQDFIEGDWFEDKDRPHHTGEVYLNGQSLWEAHLLERVLDPSSVSGGRGREDEDAIHCWFCESDEKNTYIYANFGDQNPNEELVEINVRPYCFYPDQPGRNYITVRGFHMSHGATQWAAPTAEQVGLIGTHWSKGWIIEDNVISDSKCVGITLGKDRATGHNVWLKDPSKDGAIHYNEVIDRALENGWSRETIGSHIVRNNVIYNCEQAGICGSLGAIFSEITHNHIYNIYVKRQFTGFEMAGIKIHAAIDVVMKGNRIHDAYLGIWIDWMAQGTRITGNLCYANDFHDLFIEVNHGPFLIDNNLLLSASSILDWSQGGAFAHNFFAGQLTCAPELKRFTPYHQAHSTALAGHSNIEGGDHRYYNNIFSGPIGEERPQDAKFGLGSYNDQQLPLQTGGNLYYGSARPWASESNPLIEADIDVDPEIVEQEDGVYLHVTLDSKAQQANTVPVNTDLLGTTKVSGLKYDNPDGSNLEVNIDYFGRRREMEPPSAGPFDHPESGRVVIKVSGRLV